MAEYDVMVVGAGGAGLSAAVSAAEAGARTLVFESEGEVGGSLPESAGMFTAAPWANDNLSGNGCTSPAAHKIISA